MKDILYDWIKNIVYYLILVGLILNILPNKKYEKYVKMLFGIIIIVILINPILKLVGLTEQIDASLITRFYEQELNLNNDSIFEMVEEQEEKIFDEYELEITKNLDKIVSEEGFTSISSQIVFCVNEESTEYGKIENIHMTLSKEKINNKVYIEKINIGNKGSDESEDIEIIKVKNRIMEVYNLPYENINITIQR